jgi:hypothetical protein
MFRIRIRQGVVYLLAGLCFSLSSPQAAFPTSSYQDFSRTAYFLISPPQLSLEGRAARTQASNNEAAIYTLGALMPFRLFLFQLEVPYISLVANDGILDGFGDPVLRLRFTACGGESAAVFLLSGVRMGSLPFLLSDDTLFPYSTGSLDFSFGAAFVDTLGTVAWWTSITGTYPTRVEDALKDSGLHGSYSTFSAGTRFPVARKLDLQLGAAMYFPANGSLRPVYFAGIDWRYTAVAGFYAYGQYEDRTEQDWAPDYTVGVGTKFNF